jgi:eukaryotic-like serine/threonine-protein kinase
MLISDEVAQRVQSRVGTTIADKWRLSRVLGIGGMAAVYAAVHRNQNRVAIKMLHPEQSLNETVRTRFLREGYVANTVDHAGAVRVFDDGVLEGSAYLVMELLEGESLEDRRERLGGRLPASDVLALCDKLLDTLAAAHEKGIIHRDIKPDNLFLTDDGVLKVLDFGIARLHELSQPGGTTAGTFMGTPSFMSPEQARGRWAEVDARSDLWAVGATMFYLLTGRLVHDGETFADQLALAVREPAPPLSSIDVKLPEVVTELVDRALAYRPVNRFESALSMQVAVRAALRVTGPSQTSSIRAELNSDHRRLAGEHQTLLATPDPQTPGRDRRTSAGAVAIVATSPEEHAKSGRRWWLALAAAALLFLVLLGTRWVTGGQASPPVVTEHASAAEHARNAPPHAEPAQTSTAAVQNKGVKLEAAKPIEVTPSALPAPMQVQPARTQERRRAELAHKNEATAKAAPPPPATTQEPASAASAAKSESLLDKRF